MICSRQGLGPAHSLLILFSCLGPLSPIRGVLESVVHSSLFASIRVHLRFLSFPHFGCGFAALGPFACPAQQTFFGVS